LAQRIANELDIHSFEELERAAHDGTLKKSRGLRPNVSNRSR
jgi:hypothetical protein